MFSHRRLLLIALPLVLGVFFIITSVNLTAQQEEWTPENLQVLSEDMSRDQVGAIMSQFTDALGVGCGHCHASTPESGGRLDFASDLNANKDVAREMMHMTQTINMDLLPATGRDNLLSVQCMTCHNGLARPTTLQQEIMAAYDAGGPDSAVTRYQELRQQYYGRTAFDFGEQALLAVAGNFQESNNAGLAEIFLDLNLKYFPESVNTYRQLAGLFQNEGNQEVAVYYLQRALDIDPENGFLRRQMEEMMSDND